MTPEEFKQSEIDKNYLPPFGGPYSEFDKGCAHGYSEGFDAAIKLLAANGPNWPDEDQEWMNAPMGEPKDVTNIPKNKMSTIPKEIREEIRKQISLESFRYAKFLYTHAKDEDIKESSQYDAYKDGAEYGYQLATDGREELEKELAQLLHDVQQILSAYAMDETWTDWDESVRKRVIELQYKLQDNGNSK